MVAADYVILGLILLFLVLGVIVGFGKGLRFFTKGIFGFILSIFICYLFGGFIYSIPFVQNIMQAFIEALQGKGGFCNFLLLIRIDIVVYYIVLFIVTQLVRILIVLVISKTFEMQNVFVKAINRVFGAVLFVGVFVVLTLFVFQIIFAVSGTDPTGFYGKLDGSAMKLDLLYENNPLNDIISILFKKIEIQVPSEV